MRDVTGLRVLVQGDLPDDVMRRISTAVRATVLAELSEIDIAPTVFEVPLQETGKPAAEATGSDEDLGVRELVIPLVPELLGIWLKIGDETGAGPGAAAILPS